MNINTFLEKVSWKLHRVSFKVTLFSIGYYGDSSAFNFRFFTVLNKLHEGSLLAFSFRLPNKTYVKRFVVDHWDFLFLRHSLYKEFERLIDKELWTRRGLTKMDRLKMRILRKFF
jgi:hypothetical protein